MKIQTMLNEEIQSQIEGLGDMQLGSEEYEKTVNGIAKLSDKMIEIEKLNIEGEKQFDEKTAKNLQLDEERKDRRWRNGLAIANLTLLALGTYGAYRYEEKGTITTQIGRNFVNWFKPKTK